jgi:hypothetical protein
VGPRVGLDTEARGKILRSRRAILNILIEEHIPEKRRKLNLCIPPQTTYFVPNLHFILSCLKHFIL